MKKEILLEDEDLIDYMEGELGLEDMRRVLLALEASPQMRGRYNEYLLVKDRLKRWPPEAKDVDLNALHSKIMLQVEAENLKKK
jgi:negative regulator of sigma E activity